MPAAIAGLGFVTVALVGRAAGARAANWVCVRSTICRITSIPLPVEAFASDGERPGREAMGMRISLEVVSNVYPAKMSIGEICINQVISLTFKA